MEREGVQLCTVVATCEKIANDNYISEGYRTLRFELDTPKTFLGIICGKYTSLSCLLYPPQGLDLESV